MSALLISYDLKKPGQDYSTLHKAIKELGSTWWHYLESTWLVSTSLTPSTAWNAISSHVDKNDVVLILDVSRDSFQGWLEPEAWDWIKKYV